MAPDAEFPAPRGAGYLVRYAVERVGGVGPWAFPLTRIEPSWLVVAP